MQVELPDDWLPSGECWLVPRPDKAFTVRFGGTLKESWSGQVVNGKREGVWKFLGTYTRYQWSGNVHYTGTVTMTRSYKNGIPHGTYSINQNITQEAGEYRRPL